jgi:hypothetical protein
LPNPDYDRSVFVNCPFDAAFAPLLEAILFSILYLDLIPRISREKNNAAIPRLETIQELIAASRYSIHDLSRAKATKKGELYRMNMPFELGLDYGCRRYGGEEYTHKSMLVLEEKPYRYQAALSDLAGCDIESHNNEVPLVFKCLRNWLVKEAGANSAISASVIIGHYTDFRGWQYDRKNRLGFSDADIRGTPTMELMTEMTTWLSLERSGLARP